MQNDKIQIEMKEKAPHKVCKVRNKRPVTDKYELIPKMCPQLKDFVRSIQWNCAKQCLKINIYETPKFEAYDWLSTINDRKKDAQKSPFCDLEDDAIILKVLDESENEVASFRFVDLELVAHSCEWKPLDMGLEGNIGDNFLIHHIKINYRKVLKLADKEPFETNVPVTTEKFMDFEWQSKEVSE